MCDSLYITKNIQSIFWGIDRIYTCRNFFFTRWVEDFYSFRIDRIQSNILFLFPHTRNIEGIPICSWLTQFIFRTPIDTTSKSYRRFFIIRNTLYAFTDRYIWSQMTYKSWLSSDIFNERFKKFVGFWDRMYSRINICLCMTIGNTIPWTHNKRCISYVRNGKNLFFLPYLFSLEIIGKLYNSIIESISAWLKLFPSIPISRRFSYTNIFGSDIEKQKKNHWKTHTS